MVRAMKRKDLLNATEHLLPDSVGRIKRRNSDERLSASAPPCENDDRDALVYIHKVRPHDTLAGLSIRYNCDQAILRKSNRMWPNDSVQTKQTIVLPVDACGVKGRPARGPDALPEEDLLLGDYGDDSNRNTPKPDANGLPNGWSMPRHKDAETNGNMIPGCCCLMTSNPHKSAACLEGHSAFSLLHGGSLSPIRTHLLLGHLSTYLVRLRLRIHSQAPHHNQLDPARTATSPPCPPTVNNGIHQGMDGVCMGLVVLVRSAGMCVVLDLRRMV
jgi:hypothetical protein